MFDGDARAYLSEAPEDFSPLRASHHKGEMTVLQNNVALTLQICKNKHLKDNRE
jgi:hypothetical protein